MRHSFISSIKLLLERKTESVELRCIIKTSEKTESEKIMLMILDEIAKYHSDVK